MRARLSLALIAVLVALGAAGATPASAAEPGCTSTPTGGTVTRTLGDRTYTVRVPQGLAADAPLLLVLHGAFSNSSTVESFTGWSAFADQRKFIVAYPQARPSSYGGVWDPYTPGTADVAYLRAVVADISSSWCVDPRRVHSDGWSNGAVTSQRLACAAADTFASVTSYGGGSPTAGGGATACSPSRPISVGLFAGQFDFTYFGLAQNTAEWVGHNGCSPTPAHTTDAYGTLDTYGCANGTQVLSRVVGATSHDWPSGARGADQRERMWAFFTANPRPA